jgi:hypothetical protein
VFRFIIDDVTRDILILLNRESQKSLSALEIYHSLYAVHALTIPKINQKLAVLHGEKVILRRTESKGMGSGQRSEKLFFYISEKGKTILKSLEEES